MRVPSHRPTSVEKLTLVILTTAMMANTVMRGGSDTILTVIYLTLQIAVQSAQNAPMRDMLPCIGTNNHPCLGSHYSEVQQEAKMYCNFH